MDIGDGDAVADGGDASVICSICMEAVTDAGTKSWAKLLCGHQFHLDCIGSAFNAKGAMQCPNCRSVEDGQWLYANGSNELPEFAVDMDDNDWAEEEETPDVTYLETSYGFHWCPYNGFTRIAPSYEDGEFPSTTYHDVYAEVTPLSSSTHPCPYYLTYYGPSYPSSAPIPGSVSDGSAYVGYWSGPSVTSSFFGSYAYPSVSWDLSSPFGATNHVTGPRMVQSGSDVPRPAVRPFMLGSSITSSSADMQASLARRRQSTAGSPQGPLVSSSAHQGSAHVVGPTVVAAAASSLAEQQNGGGAFYYVSTAPTAFQEAPHGGHFHYSWDPSSYPPNGRQ